MGTDAPLALHPMQCVCVLCNLCVGVPNFIALLTLSLSLLTVVNPIHNTLVLLRQSNSQYASIAAGIARRPCLSS